MGRLSIQAQEDLLRTCIGEGIGLSEALRSQGHTYDDLIYRVNAPVIPTIATFHSPVDFNFPETAIPSVSFFSGGGGMDIGFRKAGFSVLGAFEINQTFCETLRANDPSLSVYGPPHGDGDLRNREAVAAILENQIGVATDFDGLFFGGPPCQPFSIAANQRFAKWGGNFKRVGFAHADEGMLLQDYAWYIQHFKPKAFVLESVPGLITVDRGVELTKVLASLAEDGYEVTGPTILDAAHYGIPQHRNRLFVVGWRGHGKFEWPAQDLLPVPCQKALEGVPNGDLSHVTREHRAESITRYMNLSYGQRDKLGRVDRLDPNRCAKTVIAGGHRGGGRSPLHPHIPRTLSPRECARLQTFPDSYKFCGSPARQLTQIGNAVPPLLAMKIARSVQSGVFS